jgi:hypothetical protein
MLQILQSLARWTPVGMGSYFTISLLSTSQWTQAAIATCTTLGWLSITYTNWTPSRWIHDIFKTLIECSSDAFKTLITFFWRASIGLFFATATSLSRDSRRGKDLGFSHDFSAASLGENWHLF